VCVENHRHHTHMPCRKTAAALTCRTRPDISLHNKNVTWEYVIDTALPYIENIFSHKVQNYMKWIYKAAIAHETGDSSSNSVRFWWSTEDTTKELETSKPERRHLKEHLKGSNMWNTQQCILSYNYVGHSGMIWTGAAILANKRL